MAALALPPAALLCLESCLFMAYQSLPLTVLPAPRLRYMWGKAAASLSKSSAASPCFPIVPRLLVPPSRPQRQVGQTLGARSL